MTDGEVTTDLIDRIDGGVAKAEGILLVVALAIMVGLAALQFILRLVFDFSFDWGDIVVRHMVLWLAFLGGALATHQGRHIAIDAVSKMIAPRKAAAIRAFSSVIAAGVSCILVYAAWGFLSDEIENKSTAFGEVPTWPFEVILPVGFAVIAFHFLVAARRQTLIALGKRPAPLPEGAVEGDEIPTAEEEAPIEDIEPTPDTEAEAPEEPAETPSSANESSSADEEPKA